MYLHKTSSLLKKMFSHYEWDVPNTHNTIYLTFDDGPIPIVTPWVLQILKEYNAKATFFGVGENVVRYPEIFAKILEQGHIVGNHTFNHMDGWRCSAQDYLSNIEKCQKAISLKTAEGIKLFRPPYGRINRKASRKIANDFKIVMWDVLSADYDTKLMPEQCLKKTIKATISGSIVLFHDSLKARNNLQYVLPKYLEHFSKLGYNFDLLPW